MQNIAKLVWNTLSSLDETLEGRRSLTGRYQDEQKNKKSGYENTSGKKTLKKQEWFLPREEKTSNL